VIRNEKVVISGTSRLNLTITLLVVLLALVGKLAHSFGAWQADWDAWRKRTDHRLDALEGRQTWREVPPEVGR
jgi:hypothetical protein